MYSIGEAPEGSEACEAEVLTVGSAVVFGGDVPSSHVPDPEVKLSPLSELPSVGICASVVDSGLTEDTTIVVSVIVVLGSKVVS